MPEMPQSEIDALGGFRFLASKYGGSPQSIAKKIEDLEEDNRKYRAEKAALEGRLPKDGEVVIAKEQLDLLSNYEKLGKPEEIAKKLEQGTQAQESLADIERRNAAVAFARAAGLADEAVDTLIAIPSLKDAKFEVKKGKIKDAQGNETEGDVAYLTLAGDNQQAMSFEKAGEAVPALKGLARKTSETPPTNRPFVPQGGPPSPEKSGDKKSLVEAAIENNKKAASAPNALQSILTAKE